MFISINEFRQHIKEYNDSALRNYYDKLVQNGSPEQEALLNTAEFFELNLDQVHQALNRIGGTIY